MANGDLVKRAEEYARAQHEGQMYGERPYSYHLQQVAEIAEEYAHLLDSDEDRQTAIAAAWCHDVLEDCNITYNDFAEALNTKVADVVYRVTNEVGKNRKERAFRTYPKIWECELATYVKLCDRLANIRSSAADSNRLLKAYSKEHTVFKYALHSEKYAPIWDEIESVLNS